MITLTIQNQTGSGVIFGGFSYLRTIQNLYEAQNSDRSIGLEKSQLYYPNNVLTYVLNYRFMVLK